MHRTPNIVCMVTAPSVRTPDHPPRDRERGERDEEHGDEASACGAELAESDQRRGRAEHGDRDHDVGHPLITGLACEA